MMEKLEHLAGMILSEAKALGASYAQCTVTEDTTKEFNVDGGQFSLMRTLFDRGVSITMLKNQRKGAVQLNCFDDEAIRSEVRILLPVNPSAIRMLSFSGQKSFWKTLHSVTRRFSSSK